MMNEDQTDLSPEAAPQQQPAADTKWYVLRVVSGKERKIKEHLEKEIRLSGWSSIITQVLCPIEKVVKITGGKKMLREKILFPGYLMLEVTSGRMADDMVQVITSVSNVIHFLGRENPTSLRKSEVNKMFGTVDEVAEAGLGYADPFTVGETVNIIDGPFNEFNGLVEEVNEEKKKLKVVVKIFGRSTPVELTYMQVEKLS